MFVDIMGVSETHQLAAGKDLVNLINKQYNLEHG